MDFPIRTIPTSEFPTLLGEIPSPPRQLFVRGTIAPEENKVLAVVGSRDYSTYGKQVVEYLIAGLRGFPITIVSGLALGIDSLAHSAALDAKLHTIAVPGSGISDSVLYPARNRGLARAILESGGGLLSEFDPTFRATTWSFPARNRIMVGLSHAVLMIEAKEKSGTLITARLTADYNRELLVVPGNIFSENTQGTHQFLKLGATPITTPEDILVALGIPKEAAREESGASSLSPELRHIYELLIEPKDRDTIIREAGLSAQETNVYLMELELLGYIAEENGVFYIAPSYR